MKKKELKEIFSIEKLRKDLFEYFGEELSNGNNVVSIEKIDEDENNPTEIKLFLGDQIIPLSISISEPLDEKISVIPISVRIAVGNDVVIRNGYPINNKLILDIEYDKDFNCTSIDW